MFPKIARLQCFFSIYFSLWLWCRNLYVLWRFIDMLFIQICHSCRFINEWSSSFLSQNQSITLFFSKRHLYLLSFMFHLFILVHDQLSLVIKKFTIDNSVEVKHLVLSCSLFDLLRILFIILFIIPLAIVCLLQLVGSKQWDSTACFH